MNIWGVHCIESRTISQIWRWHHLSLTYPPFGKRANQLFTILNEFCHRIGAGKGHLFRLLAHAASVITLCCHSKYAFGQLKIWLKIYVCTVVFHCTWKSLLSKDLLKFFYADISATTKLFSPFLQLSRWTVVFQGPFLQVSDRIWHWKKNIYKIKGFGEGRTKNLAPPNKMTAWENMDWFG